MTPKEKEIFVIEQTLKDIFKRDEIRKIDVTAANKLFDKWKVLTNYIKYDKTPVEESIIDEEPDWKNKKTMKDYKTINQNKVDMEIGYESSKKIYSEDDLKCAWDSSDQNMRFQFSSSAYKGITFKQWLEKFKEEKNVIDR